MFNTFPFTVALDRNLAVEFPSTEMYSLDLFNSLKSTILYPRGIFTFIL